MPPSSSTAKILSKLRGAATAAKEVVKIVVSGIIPFESDKIPKKYDFKLESTSDSNDKPPTSEALSQDKKVDKQQPPSPTIGGS